MATSSNLSELTVTCKQCGGGSMERLGPREYRCNHCGAITVVSQDQVDRANATARPGPQTASASAVQAAGQSLGTAARGVRRVVWLGLLALVALGIFVANHDTSSSSPSTSTASAPPPIAPGLVTLSPAVWSNDPSSAVGSGHYTALLSNHSPWPIQVPRYSMTLFLRGVRGATATSEAPLQRLLPGEYEPISFAFESPSDDPHTEINGPDRIERASADTVPLTLRAQQLVKEEGKPGYRLAGVVSNSGSQPVPGSEVLVMLFGANHTLLGYGRGYTRALRTGEQAAVEVLIPTTNINPVSSYEYLVDASPDSK